MSASDALVADLKQQVLALEADLRERSELPEFSGAWHREHEAAQAAERTAATYTAWADDRITQAAVSWVLTTVFVRFCEDNRLLRPVWIAGPTAERRQEAMDAQLAYFRGHPENTDREWLEQAIAHLAATPATAGLVDDQAMLHTISPSGQAVTRLLAFWRRTDEKGSLIHDLTDPDLDTRFLGEVYQDLSDHAKKTYALLQTPVFVEEFILDRTLEPALNDRPLDGFKLIDPACGSGHFLLGAFQRLLARWDSEAPALGVRERAQKALDAVWGVDINPFAVEIAAFRLTVAALQAIGQRSLEDAPGFRIHVLAGDSLWFSHDQDALFGAHESFAYSTEHAHELAEALLLGQYDAVVSNPPYITVKDPKLSASYREKFAYLRGKYQLTAPFMELLFRLAKPANAGTVGWVGQITSNAFMKREFGVPMVEDLLAHLDLRLVVDTSGAYIPGHGTPTVILIGRNCPAATEGVPAVLGKRGEPGRPAVPSEGVVWKAITDNFAVPGYEDQWISVENVPRLQFSRHPWSLTGGGAAALTAKIDKAPLRLSSHLEAIGYSSITGDDEFLVTLRHHAKRLNSPAIRYVIGEEIRDYRYYSEYVSLVPQTPSGVPIEPSSRLLHHLWRGKAVLANRLYFGKRPNDRGLRWFDYAIFFAGRSGASLKIVYSNIGTHNHFALDRNQSVFNAHGQVIVVRDRATSPGMMAALNSSTACFWLKQNSHNKGEGGGARVEAGYAARGEAHRDTYEFTGTTLQDFPLPKELPLERGRRLDSLARELSGQQVSSLIENATPTAELLREAESAQVSLRGRMISQQEELDWEVYRLYGLIDEDLTYPGEPPEVRLGERAFEIVLARRIAAGEEETSWFVRHGSTPITETPDHWPADYRDVVQRRIGAIGSIDAIRLLETPEYKRRWSSEPFAQQSERALRGWLLDRLEERPLWLGDQGHPTPTSVGQLADRLGRDAEFVGVVDLWRGMKDADLVDALTDLLDPEAVPYLAAMRLKDSGLRKFAEWQRTWDLQRREDAGEKVGTIPVPPKYTGADFRRQSHWSARGKLDVPKERFIAYPGAGRATDPTPLIGWAGWDHAQQSLALATIIQQRQAEGVPDETLVPLVAGMAELQPWVNQWHADVDPSFGLSPAAFCGEQLRAHLQDLALTLDDLAAWRPTPGTRGRKPRR